MASAPLSFIMPLAGGNVDILLVKRVDEAIHLRDAAAPIAGEVMTQGFGLADALVSVSLDILQQFVDLACDLAILLHPRHEVPPCILREHLIHRAAAPILQTTLL